MTQILTGAAEWRLLCQVFQLTFEQLEHRSQEVAQQQGQIQTS